MLVLTAREVAELLPMAVAIDAVREALVLQSRGRVDVPARLQFHTRRPSGEILVMPGVLSDDPLFAIKIWSRVEPEDAGPRTSALVLVTDPRTGREALLDGGVITDMRTGALSGLAAHHLAPKGAAVAGVVGAGIQARTQILALVEALPTLRLVRVWSRTASRVQAFVAQLSTELGDTYRVRIETADSAEAAVRGGDVVVAATTARAPVVHDDWVQDGALVCGVGSHDPSAVEIDPATVSRAQCVVVDTFAGAGRGSGDIAIPLQEGLIRRADVLELGDLVSGATPVQRDQHGVAVFKSVGFAAADLVAARTVLARATDHGMGTQLLVHDAEGPEAG